MAVGFTDDSAFRGTILPDPNAAPVAPWALQFSRFVGVDGEPGAHDIAAGLGDGAIIAHPDTGYTEHPELLHGAADKITGPRTFTDPFPSTLSLGRNRARALLEQEWHGPVPPVIVWTPRGLRWIDGSAPYISYPDDGKDPLYGIFPFNPSHGTSTASLFMSSAGAPPTANFPDYAQDAQDVSGHAPTAITGAAPNARLMPLRVADTVIIDPIVADNLQKALLWSATRSMADPSVGVVSISMGWPFPGMSVRYGALAKAIEAATDAGLVICAAAAQSGAPLAQWMDGLADLDEQVDDAISGALSQTSVQRIAQALQSATGVAVNGNGTLAQLTASFIDNVPVIGDADATIRAGLRLIAWLARQEAEALRAGADYIRSLVGYPGSDPNTICCAACDVNGAPMADGFYGPQVDITAPGVNMYSAKSSVRISGITSNQYYTHQSSGTSYATAITAGACALWQSHFGRQQMIDDYTRPLQLHLFRWALSRSAKKHTAQFPASTASQWDRNRGMGILDVHALLSAGLPASPQVLLDDLLQDGLIDETTNTRLRQQAGLTP